LAAQRFNINMMRFEEVFLIDEEVKK
jgi:hypothetical protein